MASSLIRGRHVITRAIDDREVEIVEDGAVYQVDGEIVAVGAYADLERKHGPVDTVGSGDHIVMPGLVNTHHHVGLTPLQLGTPDYPLELWLTARLSARNVDPYLDTLYSAFEMIASGVTTVQHLDMMRPGSIDAWTARAHRVLQAYLDVGMRSSYALCVRDQNRIVYAPDEAFCQTLPGDLAREVEEWLSGTRLDPDDFEAGFLDPPL